jgi:hypothetical protein
VEIDEFLEVCGQMKAKKPRLFQRSTLDSLATPAHIEAVERALGLTLPAAYSSFLKALGGGELGFLVVFSVDPNSKWFLLDRVNRSKGVIPPGFIPFSDDFTGGYYLLKADSDLASNSVYFWAQDDRTPPSLLHEDLLTFIAQHAFEP